jgi:hypothetical protein
VHKNLSEAAVYLDTEKSGPGHFSSPLSTLWFRTHPSPPLLFLSPFPVLPASEALFFCFSQKELSYLQIHKYAKQGPTQLFKPKDVVQSLE